MHAGTVKAVAKTTKYSQLEFLKIKLLINSGVKLCPKVFSMYYC
jgi:hypothetical protein